MNVLSYDPRDLLTLLADQKPTSSACANIESTGVLTDVVHAANSGHLIKWNNHPVLRSALRGAKNIRAGGEVFPSNVTAATSIVRARLRKLFGKDSGNALSDIPPSRVHPRDTRTDIHVFQLSEVATTVYKTPYIKAWLDNAQLEFADAFDGLGLLDQHAAELTRLYGFKTRTQLLCLAYIKGTSARAVRYEIVSTNNDKINPGQSSAQIVRRIPRNWKARHYIVAIPKC